MVPATLVGNEDVSLAAPLKPLDNDTLIVDAIVEHARVAQRRFRARR